MELFCFLFCLFLFSAFTFRFLIFWRVLTNYANHKSACDYSICHLCTEQNK
jgi:hypothetical protein